MDEYLGRIDHWISLGKLSEFDSFSAIKIE